MTVMATPANFFSMNACCANWAPGEVNAERRFSIVRLTWSAVPSHWSCAWPNSGGVTGVLSSIRAEACQLWLAPSMMLSGVAGLTLRSAAVCVERLSAMS